jgi:hypothetical protein
MSRPLDSRTPANFESSTLSNNEKTKAIARPARATLALIDRPNLSRTHFAIFAGFWHGSGPDGSRDGGDASTGRLDGGDGGGGGFSHYKLHLTALHDLARQTDAFCTQLCARERERRAMYCAMYLFSPYVLPTHKPFYRRSLRSPSFCGITRTSTLVKIFTNARSTRPRLSPSQIKEGARITWLDSYLFRFLDGFHRFLPYGTAFLPNLVAHTTILECRASF